jgi:hypothetical protein
MMTLDSHHDSQVNLLPRTQELRDRLAHALHETEILRRLLKVAEYAEQHTRAPNRCATANEKAEMTK